MNPERKKIAIIGAGPVGLEAALTALDRGYEINLYERGEIADAVRQWGHVRMFSPFEMNTSQLGLARLHVAGVRLPKPEVLQTGAQFRETYLLPLARILAPHIQENCEVLAIGRSRRLKGDFIADPQRGTSPFRLLLRDSNGERIESSDVVLDCSGTFAQPNSLGDGGIPVPGEATSSARVQYGHSQLFQRRPRSLRRSARARDRSRPFGGNRNQRPGGNPEATRNHLVDPTRVSSARGGNSERSFAGAFSTRGDRESSCPGRTSATLDRRVDRSDWLRRPDGIEVHWSDPRGRTSTLLVDEIIAATGFRPDLSLTRELQVQTCWATEGTYPLAASLLGDTGADCLAAPAGGAEMLLHPEPGYFTLGMKSYGRSPNFLLRTGYEQVAAVFDWLAREGELTAL